MNRASLFHRARGSVTMALLSALAVRDSIITSTIDYDGVAEPVQQATVATKLMGTVAEVFVHEGDRVTLGQPLVRIDARDVDAKAAQAAAAVAAASATRDNAASTPTARRRRQRSTPPKQGWRRPKPACAPRTPAAPRWNPCATTPSSARRSPVSSRIVSSIPARSRRRGCRSQPYRMRRA